MNDYEITVRSADAFDDAAAIAKYLYLTDDLIYPSLCPSFSDTGWIDFIRANLQNRRHIFSAENLYVAEQNSRIVAVGCIFRCGAPFLFLEHVPLSDRAAYEHVDERYFRPLTDETAALCGMYINNLCVDPNCRGKGVGRALMQFIVEKFAGQDLLLDVLEDNLPAVNLYKSFGFHIQQRHPGFGGINRTDVSCFRMIRPKGVL